MIYVWCWRWFSVVVAAVFRLVIELAHTARIALFTLLVLLLPVRPTAATAAAPAAATSPTATSPRGQVRYTSSALWTKMSIAFFLFSSFPLPLLRFDMVYVSSISSIIILNRGGGRKGAILVLI
jgi:hypothetical protein